MKRAVLMLRKEVHYRHEVFRAGLQALGYDIVPDGITPDKGDVLVLWNRKSGNEHRMASVYEARGARVIIAENGYIGKDEDGHQLYAMALSGHNGSGRWFVGPEDRWSPLGIEIKPWQNNDGGHILICGQRGIGSPTMASPGGWHRRVHLEMSAAQLGRELRLRHHPGDKPPPEARTLDDDLRGCRGCVIWSSSSGVKALAAGIPVVYAAPHWVCAPAAFRYTSPPPIWVIDGGHREKAFRRMAWAQWRPREIASGEAFDCLLNRELNS